MLSLSLISSLYFLLLTHMKMNSISLNTNLIDLLDPKCRYKKICKYYKVRVYTCQHEDEACDYCGTYEKHKKYETKFSLATI